MIGVEERRRHEAAGEGLLSREWLFDRLSGVGGLAVVCGPAGSGKTALVRSWLQAAGLQKRVGWVSVERGERDAQRFWFAVIDALTEATGVARQVDAAPEFRGEAVLEQLLDDLGGLGEPAVLIIDDLHQLQSACALGLLQSFVDRLPAGLRVILTTREEPQISLHRLRLTGQLTEIRGADLSCSLEETAELLRAAGVSLSDSSAALLHERTEGWVAGLRLAAISLAGHPDPERFVSEFSGSERTVYAYLLAEVFERQPAEVRELLLRTSVLGRVCGPLADYLTGGTGAERILQELEDANAFVTALDAGRSWFRYHHLFADVLQLELRRVSPERVAPLHRAAAQWFEQEGCVIEAVRHAQAARDWPLAARLLADNHLDLTLDGRPGTIRELLRAFPDHLPAPDPELAIVFGTARMFDGELEQSAAYVDFAQQGAGALARDRRPRFDLEWAVLRVLLGRRRGDHETVLEALPLVETALAAQPMGGHALSDDLRAVALMNLGISELWSSRFADGRRDLERALELERRSRRPWLEMSTLGHLAIAAPCTGESFAVGLELSKEAMRIADAHDWGEDPNIVSGLAGGAWALLSLGQVDEAGQWLERAEHILSPGGEPGTELMVRYVSGLLQLAQGQLDEALAAFDAAERMQAMLAGEHAFAVAVRARVLQAQVRMGKLAAARTAFGDISKEERESTQMRVAGAAICCAYREPEPALDLLAPMIEGPASPIHRSSLTIEAHLLDAIAREQLGDQRAGEASLERALDLAEPEGTILPFILHDVREILEAVPAHRTAHATLRRTILDALAGTEPAPSGEVPPLLEELSPAELRVARYLPSNLRISEIASELFVSKNTVRAHVRHIYSKLDAHNRAEAVERARQLGLLAPPSRLR
jgi:LuxR family maltose regulon positive regulatory protein